MPFRKKQKLITLLFLSPLWLAFAGNSYGLDINEEIPQRTPLDVPIIAPVSKPNNTPAPLDNLTKEAIAKQLGWTSSMENRCGGYYLEPAFNYPQTADKKNLVEVHSDQVVFSQDSTSVLEGEISISYAGQEISANKAYLYRDPLTQKLTSIDFSGNVQLRAPDSLVSAQKGGFNFETKGRSLYDLIYRTRIYAHNARRAVFAREEILQDRKAAGMTAWGQAQSFSQLDPKVTELNQASYSTCSPLNPVWQVKASHIELNKNTGRGTARHARLLLRNTPILYIPYFNFSIDSQRKSGFLWPTIGTSSKFGNYLTTPFYWNMAPNYDMTITPGYTDRRDFQIADLFRYMSNKGSGRANGSFVPHDPAYAIFKETSQQTYQNSTDSPTQAELRRLLQSSDSRYSLSWQDATHINDHWSTNVDINRVSDDYYLRDFGTNLNEITQNQLLEEADLNYKGENWNFLGRFQAYQTLHPINSPIYQNQYQRFPQLILNGDYPDQVFGLEPFINNEVTHFTIQKTPGVTMVQPNGERLHSQPGVSWPLIKPYLYFTPRMQVALTQYDLINTQQTYSSSIGRSIPIFDISSGLIFSRDASLFGNAYEQTLEPRAYYTYVPYHNQSSVPVFDTTVNTLTYDQLFTYNRFNGIDRIGDANQISVGVTTRIIDKETGIEKIRAGIGDIIYFSNRRVTLCNDEGTCTDYPGNPSNEQRFSPVSGIINYNVNRNWSLAATAIWNPQSQGLDNETINLHYQLDPQRIINLGYSFARNGNIFSGITTNSAQNNLKLTDVSFAWPLKFEWSIVGRWSQDWYNSHFQSILYGLQYDSCCWAVRFGGGRQFVGINSNTTFQYNTELYVQFALKGLGSIGSGNPNTLLSNSISGYQSSQFDQDT